MIDHLSTSQTAEKDKAVSTMNKTLHNGHCHRCGGLMINDHCLDVLSDSGEVQVQVLRCCACGELIDPTILRNRLGIRHQSTRQEGQTQNHSKDFIGSASDDALMREPIHTWYDAVIQKRNKTS
ncbi:MAG: hypothetical protein NPIRA01_03460 [Nitrospirales bacterium]|nr:MAG: hypothetical protein NPIRA01_03460 [Nitrospirales bacterium]